MEVDKIIETSITAFVDSCYKDVKKMVKSKGDVFFQKGLKKFLEGQALDVKYVKNLLFGGDQLEFSRVYQPQSVKIERFEKKKYENVHEIFSKKSKLVLIGNAGVGKSTFVKMIVSESIKQEYKIPVVIELRQNQSYNKPLGVIYDKIFSKSSEVPELLIDELLKNGRFLIILDGYDEVKQEGLKEVNSFIDFIGSNYNNCPMLLTSRPFSNAEALTNFANCRLCEFSEKDVFEYIKRISYKLHDEFVKNLIGTIQTNDHDHFQQYLKNPLMLNLFILSYQTCSDVPEKMSQFYSNVVDALIYRHDTSKNSFRRKYESGLNGDEIKDFLMLFSLAANFDGKFVFDLNYVEKMTALYRKEYKFNFETSSLLNDLLKNLALWLKEGGNYSFAHRSLQEYFFAKYVFSLTKKKELFYQKFLKALSENTLVMELDFRLKLMFEMDESNFLKFLLIPEMISMKKLIARGGSKLKLSRYITQIVPIDRIRMGDDCSLSTLVNVSNKYLYRRALIRLVNNIDPFFNDFDIKFKESVRNEIKSGESFNLDIKEDIDSLVERICNEKLEKDISNFKHHLDLFINNMKHEVQKVNSYDEMLDIMTD